MKILVTGRAGQVARSFAEAGATSDHEVVFAARPEVDLEKPGSLTAAIERARPGLVINAAAYTAVDSAETDRNRALWINGDAAGEGALAASRIGARFIQLSTDYVFDGQSRRPYREDDATHPVNVYGATKLAGEQAVAAANPNALIVRTSWVISPFGRNFIKTMLRLANEREEIAVVDDQLGCPTDAGHLADALMAMVDRGADEIPIGVLHLAGSGSTSWAGLAEAVMAASARHGGPTATIRPISSSEFPTPAPRPPRTILDCSLAEQKWSLRLPAWETGVERIVGRLVKQGDEA